MLEELIESVEEAAFAVPGGETGVKVNVFRVSVTDVAASYWLTRCNRIVRLRVYQSAILCRIIAKFD